ncbi:MAG TPA: DUF2059 domain-containing protein [Acidobacteriaceae bacterium]|nr:DUF2059 domain-containing protein [Acidobacteriaceae bacterium]
MKRFMVVVLAVLVLRCATTRADEASKRAKAEQLFTLLRMDRLTDQLTNSVMKQVDQMTQSMPGMDRATPEQKKLLADFQQSVMDLVKKNVGWKALEPDFINLYATTYTEEDLDGMLAFYQSPLGQKVLEKTPELMAKSTEIAQQKMREIQPQMNDMLQEFMKQIAATVAKPAPPESHAPAKNGP